MTQRNALLYIRVSTDEQLNGYSPEVQEECLTRYCALNNISVLGIYKEDYSAKTFERPVFNQVLMAIKKHKGTVNLLLFTRWDRFSRNAGDAYAMINVLRKMRVEPQGVEQPLDLDIPENKMMLAFYLAAPEVENDRRALNTLLGMRRSKKEGRYLGIAPVGYLNEKEKTTVKGKKDKPILVIDEKLAPLVVWVFEEVARGVHDLEKIRRMANIKGLPIKKSQIGNLVRNTVYCGKIFISAYKQEEAHYVYGIHQPLISENLFNEVQDVLSGRKKITKARSAKDEHLPLRGFLVCKRCGKPITGSGSKGNGGTYYYYHCQSSTSCKERFRADEAHEIFKKKLGTIKGKEDVINLYMDILSRELKAGNEQNDKQITEIQGTIDKLKQRIINAQTLMLDAEIGPAEYTNIKNNLRTEIEAQERRKMELVTDYGEQQRYIDKGRTILVNAVWHYENGDLDAKQKIIGSMFPSKLIFEKNDYRTIEPNPILELIAFPVKDLEVLKNEKVGDSSDLSTLVPRTGFEPAHPCERCDLNTVRLPISPSGQQLICVSGLQR